MGHIRHRTVIATVPMFLSSDQSRRERIPGHDIPGKLALFEPSMPPHIQHLLKGPIPAPVNGIHTWFFATEGSKGGWEEDSEVREWQEKFIGVFTRPECYEIDGGHTCSVIVVQWPDFAPLAEPTVVRRV